MAAADGAQRAGLELLERLVATGRIPRTTFFNAVRLLERLTPESVRVGGPGPFRDERIAFGHSPRLVSHPNELSEIRLETIARVGEHRLDKKRTRYRIETCFLGVSGSDAPAPLYLTGELANESPEADDQNAFLDLFHNRLTALFYRLISRYFWPGEFRCDGSDPASLRLLAFAGVDVYDVPHTVTRADLLRISGLLALGGSTPRSVRNGLRSIVRQELGDAPLELQQFTGGWVNVDPSQHNKLGRANNEAGNTFMIGTRVWHPAHRSTVTVGPMSPQQAALFAPGNRGHERIVGALRGLQNSAVAFELEVLVREGPHQRFVLGKREIGQDAYISGHPGRDRLTRRVYDISDDRSSRRSRSRSR